MCVWGGEGDEGGREVNKVSEKPIKEGKESWMRCGAVWEAGGS